MRGIMKYVYSFMVVFIFLLLPSCGEDLTSAQEVIKLEVLAIKSDKPEVHAGDEVVSEVLIGKPEDDTTEYHSVWFLCDPKSDGSSSTSFANCMNPTENNLIGMPAIDTETFTTTIPENVLAGNLKSKYMYILHVLCKGTVEACSAPMTGGMSENPLESDIYHLTLKRIHVVATDAEIKNQNPVIEAVYLNDEALTSNDIKLTEKGTFKVKINADSFDKKEDVNGDLVDEEITTAWKSNNGKFDYYYTNQNKDETLADFDENPFKLPEVAVDAYKIYIIATDTRGGVDWRVLNVTK